MTTTTSTTEPTHTVFHPDPLAIRRAIERRSVATLATVSAIGRPHVATVLYQCADDALFVSTHGESRKARNIADNGVAAVTIAVRRLPDRSTRQHPVPDVRRGPRQRRLRDQAPRRGGQARPDHCPRRADPRRRLLPPTGAPGPRPHLRAGNVTVAGHAQPARRGRRSQPALRLTVGTHTGRTVRRNRSDRTDCDGQNDV